MNRSIFFLLSALLCTVVACTPAHTVTTLQFTGYSVGKPLPNDSGMLGFLQPYAQTMNASMNKVIGFTNNTLIHKQPESALGNFLADCITQMAEKKFNRKVFAARKNHSDDFVLQNNFITESPPYLYCLKPVVKLYFDPG